MIKERSRITGKKMKWRIIPEAKASAAGGGYPFSARRTLSVNGPDLHGFSPTSKPV
jgi:hypothetical protein